MTDLKDVLVRDDLLIVEPWDEEGETPSGIWLDHVWEEVAGHAFGIVLKGGAKALRQVSLGDLVLFTRAAHEKVKLEVDGKDSDLLFVNIEDVIGILTEEGDEVASRNCMDRTDAPENSGDGTSLGPIPCSTS